MDPALPTQPVSADLHDAVLTWYWAGGRRLPFRASTDPWAILVSEVMAQQTQAARAGERWSAFMTRFPTVEALALASPADVLRAWRGLGYNRRALDLRSAARRIVDDFGGHVPRTLAALLSLPGVGPYTARAVAAIAFEIPVGAVDTNVRRVLGRIVAGDPVSVPAGELQRIADAAVPSDRAAAWTHAMMDIGAMFCRPDRPDCAACPARSWCRFTKNARSTATRRATATRATAVPFIATNRWLRGRIIDRLRDAPDGEWVMLAEPIGEHGSELVATAVRALAAEGLLELAGGPGSALAARLPVSDR
ncbi:MAG: A/G-specific adenine glycosylase [Chloroflexi bacterium]|nr:A/G-specific adenine glycosylase [Chloroflexota bacterium]